MYPIVENTIAENVLTGTVSEERKEVLQPLIKCIQEKLSNNEQININFICTHNSRRSHLAQIWAQVAASYYNIKKCYCYSGGTEETAVFPKVIDTLGQQGLNIVKLSEDKNPVYAIKFADNYAPIIGFSKKYNHPFNPKNEFIAVMTCSDADGGCPFVTGAQHRIAITYNDPKSSDNTAHQNEVYRQRSLEIASEMFYVFSMLKLCKPN